MNQWTPRTVSGTKFLGFGIFLLASTEQAKDAAAGSPLWSSLAQLFCSGLGLILFAIGAYRLVTRHKAE